MQDFYLGKLDLYDGEEMIYDSPIEKGRKVHMKTSLDLKESRMEMLYKFYKSRKGWLIYDLEIGGVSTVQTYRSQFDGVLEDGSIDDLISKLKRPRKFSDEEKAK